LSIDQELGISRWREGNVDAFALSARQIGLCPNQLLGPDKEQSHTAKVGTSSPPPPPPNLPHVNHQQLTTDPPPQHNNARGTTQVAEVLVASLHCRLYVRGKHVSFTRGKRNSKPNTSLIKIEGCDSIQDAEFYLGKRIAYVYKVWNIFQECTDDRLNGQSGEARFESFGEK